MCSVEGCEKLCSDKRSLANHIRVHESGQFPCPVCPRIYSRKDNRDIHIKKKHGTTSTSPAPRDPSPPLPPAPRPPSPPPTRIPSPIPLLSISLPSSVSSPTSVANESVAQLPSLVASMQSAMTTVMHSFTSSIAAELRAAVQAVSRVDVPSPTATSSSTTKIDPPAPPIRPKEAVIPSNTVVSNVADRRATAMEREIADLKEQLKEAKATSDCWKSKFEEAERLRVEAARSRVVAEKSATALQKEVASKQKTLEAVQADLAASRKALEQQQSQSKKYNQVVQTAAAVARQLRNATDELQALAVLTSDAPFSATLVSQLDPPTVVPVPPVSTVPCITPPITISCSPPSALTSSAQATEIMVTSTPLPPASLPSPSPASSNPSSMSRPVPLMSKSIPRLKNDAPRTFAPCKPSTSQSATNAVAPLMSLTVKQPPRKEEGFNNGQHGDKRPRPPSLSPVRSAHTASSGSDDEERRKQRTRLKQYKK